MDNVTPIRTSTLDSLRLLLADVAEPNRILVIMEYDNDLDWMLVGKEVTTRAHAIGMCVAATQEILNDDQD